MLLSVHVGDEHFMFATLLEGITNGGRNSGVGRHCSFTASDIQFILLVSWGCYLLRANRYITLR